MKAAPALMPFIQQEMSRFSFAQCSFWSAREMGIIIQGAFSTSENMKKGAEQPTEGNTTGSSPKAERRASVTTGTYLLSSGVLVAGRPAYWRTSMSPKPRASRCRRSSSVISSGCWPGTRRMSMKHLASSTSTFLLPSM